MGLRKGNPILNTAMIIYQQFDGLPVTLMVPGSFSCRLGFIRSFDSLVAPVRRCDL